MNFFEKNNINQYDFDNNYVEREFLNETLEGYTETSIDDGFFAKSSGCQEKQHVTLNEPEKTVPTIKKSFRAFLHLDENGKVIPDDIIPAFIHISDDERTATDPESRTEDKSLVQAQTKCLSASVNSNVIIPYKYPTVDASQNDKGYSIISANSMQDDKIRVQVLVDTFITKFTVVNVSKNFYIYTGIYYKRHSESDLRVIVQSFCRHIVGERLTSYIVDGVIKLLLSDDRIMNDSLTNDNNYIAFRNGLYSIAESRLVDSFPSIFCIHYINTEYISGVTGYDFPPCLAAFLNSASGGNPALAKRILQFAAIALSPLKPKKIFVLFGASDSGKSVLLRLLTLLLGTDDCGEFKLERLDSRFELTSANGKNLFFDFDASARAVNSDVCDVLKKLVSPADRLEFESKGKDKTALDTSRLKVVIASNHQITTEQHDAGIENRLTYVVLPNSIPAEQQIEGLPDILFKEAADQLVSFCISTILSELISSHYVMEGEAETLRLITYVVEALTPEETVSAFLLARTYFTDCDKYVTTQRLYEEYLTFTNGACKITNIKNFSAIVNKLCGDKVKKDRVIEFGHRLNAFYGLALK